MRKRYLDSCLVEALLDALGDLVTDRQKGLLRSPDGKLQIEIDGRDANVEHDLIEVTATAALEGELQVGLVAGFQGGPGDSLGILDSGSVGNPFDTVRLPALAEGLAWDASTFYTNGAFSVTVVPEPSAVLLACWVLVAMLGPAGLLLTRKSPQNSKARHENW